MPERRSSLTRAGWTLRDYAKRVWDNSGEDNVFFLAGGIAFNILLAAVPFVLLLVGGLSYFLNESPDVATAEVRALVDRLMPTHAPTTQNPVLDGIGEIVKKRGAISLYGAIGFVWFSTRLFGSLRSVLAEVFDIDQERGIIAGKIFDIKITIISTLLVVAYTVLNAYLAIATSRGVQTLKDLGLRDDVMGHIEYGFGRLLAFVFIGVMFFSLYKFLPLRRIRADTAMIAALFTSSLLEIAKNLFTAYVQSFDPGSLYTATLSTIVIVVFWVYYAALIFILGGEVAQVYELRRVRRLQRETFEM
jgi:membrane protein